MLFFEPLFHFLDEVFVCGDDFSTCIRRLSQLLLKIHRSPIRQINHFLPYTINLPLRFMHQHPFASVRNWCNLSGRYLFPQKILQLIPHLNLQILILPMKLHNACLRLGPSISKTLLYSGAQVRHAHLETVFEILEGGAEASAMTTEFFEFKCAELIDGGCLFCKSFCKGGFAVLGCFEMVFPKLLEH